MTMAQLTEVWTPLSALFATVAGLIIGLGLIGRYVADPAYSSGIATPRRYAALVGLGIIGAGLVFYGGQILTSYLGGDTEWTRVASRFGLWVLYGMTIALGTWARLRHHRDDRRKRAHKRAVADLADDQSPRVTP